MKLTGKVTAGIEYNETGGGRIMCEMSPILMEDGTEFFGGLTIVARYPKFVDKFKPVAEEIIESIDGLEITDYDSLALAEAKICDAVDDLNHIGELYAAEHGIDLPKLREFMKETQREEEHERRAIRRAYHESLRGKKQTV